MDIGHRTGRTVPADLEEFRQDWLVADPASSLESMIAKFDRARRMWCDPHAITQLTREAIHDAAAQNVKLIEFRYAPTFILKDQDNLSYEIIHNAILEGVAQGTRECDIAVGLIGIIMRSAPKTVCDGVADFIIANADTFCAIDIADAEIGYPGRDFLPYFERARAAGLHTTAHAGEINDDESRRNVREAIELLGVERIGHGVHAHSDPALVELLASSDVVLEVCPTSNVLTGAFEHISQHPLADLIRQGVRTTINTDDPSLFGIDWNFEYQVAQTELGLTDAQLYQCTATALAASFLPEAQHIDLGPAP